MSQETTMSNDAPAMVSIHEALSEAAIESSEDKPMVPVSTKLPEKLLQSVKDICQRHGTNTSTFLRKCCELLDKEYQP